jgi:arsenite methyltransferase
MTESMVDTVREKYGETARSGLSSDDPGIRAVAVAFGYSPEELASIPAEANMGLSCGNPLATAHLKPGEVVVDLGSGGGLDVLLAAPKVGPSGKAIGIDMTEDMLDLARANAEKSGHKNVRFLKGQIDAIPMSNESTDVIISNCVINLAPDKSRVFKEMYRILKPGGRVAVSDIALKQELPQELATNVAAIVGCIAGAISISDYENGLKEAGFQHVAVLDSGADLNAYGEAAERSACCSPGSCSDPNSKPMHKDLGELLRRYNVNEYAASVKVLAVKPQ